MFPVESQADIRSEPLLPLETKLGPVRIAVTDKSKALAIWRDVVGLAIISETPREIVLGVGGQALVEIELGALRPVMAKSLGLYHVAIHVPQRRDLAAVAARALRHRVRISPTDHLVSEAIYLWDYDGNGIEITFETPWRGSYGGAEAGYYAKTANGQPHSGREPIDLDDLLGELSALSEVEPLMPVGTRIGHIHLHGDDLDRAMHFYRDGIGFGGLFILRAFGMGDVRLDYMPHTIAFNIWSGPNARQPAENTAGLRHFTIHLPDEASFTAAQQRLTSLGFPLTDTEAGFSVRDPAGNLMHLIKD